MTMKDSLKTLIYHLENQLLQPEVRQSAEKISELLSEEFFEFCSSGMIYYYKKNDIFDPSVQWVINNFNIKVLSSDTVLATYQAEKREGSMKEKTYSLRSSIWKSMNGQWKMIFHQGTLINHRDAIVNQELDK